jgi:hypothetical protein
MLATDFPESHRERAGSDRHSAIVDEIIVTAGATLGFSGAREPSPHRPAIVDTIAAVVIATLAVVVFVCVAALSPIIWTFASDAASHLRAELSQCLSVEDGSRRLACYDEIAHRPPPHPAKGANAPAAAFRHITEQPGNRNLTMRLRSIHDAGRPVFMPRLYRGRINHIAS